MDCEKFEKDLKNHFLSVFLKKIISFFVKYLYNPATLFLYGIPAIQVGQN